ncbi:CoA transferase [Salinibacterium sp. SYSU T00001]|uniref:CoA transferase n=1 Tax=Homoserinimonas sedimenticola TaxID=2986805 RepID=UPI0022368BD9|nr:CoA transferase [Salinibacterium sedimenticola]MCW4386411.1 CoA transferase [Salinibacterium sedimenticola]
METPHSFTGQFWRALDGADALLPGLRVTGVGDLPSAFRVSEFAAASVGVAGLAAAELASLVGGPSPRVSVNKLLASAWFGSAVRPAGWSLPPVWDPYTRNYRAADGGWVRLHTNAPHHRAAALGVLGVDDSADPVDVRRFVGRWDAFELEDAVVEAGGVAAAMRTRDQWLEHPQGAAVSAEPLLYRETGTPGPLGAAWRPTVERPLAGLRVLDLTRVLAGPVATRFLAGLGADVLRIDPPEWDEPAIVPNMTIGKRTSRLDARTPEGYERLCSLLAEADVLVHGYRDGALDRLGLALEERQRLRPGLVEASLNAFGFSGPWRPRRGFDSIVQVASGISHHGMVVMREERPQQLPVQALDHATGYLLAASVLRGLVGLMRDGVGSAARTSLARMGEALVAGGPQPDGVFDQWSGPCTMIGTPWGAAQLLPPPARFDEIHFGFARIPNPLGTDAAEWGPSA